MDDSRLARIYELLRETKKTQGLDRTEVGELNYVYAHVKYEHAMNHESIKVEGAGKFTKPAPNSGTVHPEAVVATIKSGNLVSKIALDALKADARRPDIIRWDLTGKGDFPNSHVIGVQKQAYIYGSEKLVFGAPKGGLMVRLGDKTVPVDFECMYEKWDNGRRKLSLNLLPTAPDRSSVSKWFKRMSPEYPSIRSSFRAENFLKRRPSKSAIHPEGSSERLH